MKIKDIKNNFAIATNLILDEIETFNFRLNQLPPVNNFKTDIRKYKHFKDIFERLNTKEENCLYWFELETTELSVELNALLDKKRTELKLNKRVVPATNKNSNSNVIYVGVRQGGKRKRDGLTNISGRIIQHLGYYEKGTTQGLQLVHWAKEEDLLIKLNVVELNELPKEYLYVIEKLVAYKLKPLCGRH